MPLGKWLMCSQIVLIGALLNYWPKLQSMQSDCFQKTTTTRVPLFFFVFYVMFLYFPFYCFFVFFVCLVFFRDLVVRRDDELVRIGIFLEPYVFKWRLLTGYYYFNLIERFLLLPSFLSYIFFIVYIFFFLMSETHVI